jgi:hypothetical protein
MRESPSEISKAKCGQSPLGVWNAPERWSANQTRIVHD